ncbi:hypothetical protein BD309DRAFT_746226 [Dichomitus squalens]|nr:hypothetical protein BD309DRAFT_746226 [Dichomitus squalens]
MASNNTPLSTKMSEWNANLSQAYRSLPAADLDRFKFQAASKNSERLSAEQSELRRAKHAAEMTSYMHTVMKTWQSQSGWVGWCAMGGLDANGQPVYHSGAKTGKDRHGLTLQERFAREFQCTPAFIDGIIQSWVLDIFDAPQAAKPLLSLSTGAGSGPSISLSAVTGNVSPKQPPVLSPGKVGDPVPERAAVALAATDAAKRADTSISTPKSAANNQFNPFDETFSSDGDDDLAAELEKDIQKKVGGDVVVQTATIVPKLPAVEVGQAHKATKSSKPKMLYEAKQSRSVTGNPPVEPPAKPLNHKSTAQQSTRGKRRGLDTATSGAAVTSPLTVNEAITKALAATEPAKKSVRPRPKVKKTNEALSAPAGDESLQNAAKGASPVSHHDGAKKASVRVVTRSGRVRVPTARSLEESPDMSAAKKLNATKKRTREDADSKGTGKKTRRA